MTSGRPVIRQILYATDLSPASEPAREEAQRPGRALGGEVVVVHVVPPVIPYPETYLPPQLYQELADAVHQEARAGVAQLTERVVEPRPKEAERFLQQWRAASCPVPTVGPPPDASPPG